MERLKQPVRTPGVSIPRHTIDLSLPPQDRYKSLARKYHDKVQSLTSLFDSLLNDLGISATWIPRVNRLARLLLRRVHSSEETVELRGISEETKVPMYLLVAFNVVLDLLMGCTSGAVRTSTTGQNDGPSKMLHFRTLDWSMDPLRSVIIQLDFVRSNSPQPGHVIASSITYFGFVGVLTGVREDLSLSLNFRAVHNAKTRVEHFRFYFHHLLVLLGFRMSISSLLRSYLTSSSHNVATVTQDLSSKHTTAAYVVICDGEQAVSVEKDFNQAVTKESTFFLAKTNHDSTYTGLTYDGHNMTTDETRDVNASSHAAGLAELLEESYDRLQYISDKWSRKVWRYAQTASSREIAPFHEAETKVTLTKNEVISWTTDWPTSNEMTHFAAVMDPKEGVFTWSRAFLKPLKPPKTA